MKRIFPFLAILFLLFSCGHEDPYAKEQKEIDEAISSPELKAYRSFKVAMRGTAATGKDSAFDQARRALLSAFVYDLSADSVKPVKISDVISSSSSLVSSVGLLAGKEEDSLPTILENISFAMNGGKIIPGDPFAAFLNESEEHIVLGGLWMGTPSAPAGISLYEIYKVKDEELRSADVKVISKFTRALICYQRKWPYHAEQSANEMVSLVEKEKNYFLQNPWPLVDTKGNLVSAEQSWHQVHGIALLMRAMARLDMEDKEEDAMKDLGLFVKDAEAGGFDDEAVWSIGALVAVKNNDKDAAMKYLDKLEASKNLSADELKAVKETIEFVEKKENDDAFAKLKNNFAVFKIAVGYAGNLVRHSKPVTQLNGTAGGKRFIAITHLGFTDVITEGENKANELLDKSKSILDKVK